MLDLHLLRHEPEHIIAGLKKRGVAYDHAQFEQLEEQRKTLQIKTEQLQNERNVLSKSIGHKKSKQEDVADLLKQVESVGRDLEQQQQTLKDVQDKIHNIVLTLPNVPHESVPVGDDENNNEELKVWGKPTVFDFDERDHVDLGEGLNAIDFKTASLISSSRFVILKGMMAKLSRALVQFMLDVHINEHGYTEVNVPYLVNEKSMLGTGQLPKFSEDLFHIEKYGFYLIPTAEVSVTNLVRDQIVPKLPLKYVCYSSCFRSEAGAYGKDTRGMLRQHQFEKVEMVQMVHADQSYQVLEELTHHAEVILQRLELPYRIVTLCTGDLGFSAAKTYDLEVWLPSQKKYFEISSCSNFEDFQARRLQARCRDPKHKKPQFLHTLNGSGLAVGRALVAIIENYQTKEGEVMIPTALQSYMGVDKIKLEE